MGSTTTFYSVKANKIKSVWGSKNIKLYKNLKMTLNDDLQDIQSYFSYELKPEGILTENVLYDIILGEVKHPNYAYLYGYIYEMLCKEYGTKISNNDFEAPRYFTGEIGLEISSFIPIPKPNNWPMFFSILNNDLKNEKNNFLDTATEFDDFYLEDYGITFSSILEKIFNHTESHQEDLVIFTY